MNGKKVESSGWEKVYVSRSLTGSISEITLIPSDLNIVARLTTNGKAENFELGKQLNDYLKIEIIDPSLLERMKSSATNYLSIDTVENKKRDGIIALQCQNKTKEYVDKPDSEESKQVFNYVGQIEFLNKYLIQGSYYESFDYKLVDKTTGEEISLVDYPYISPDKKYIICIYSNGYETSADLEMYSIQGQEVKHVVSASFMKWMPISKMFWSTDGYLYLTANHVRSFWKADGNLNDKCQALRIRIL